VKPERVVLVLSGGGMKAMAQIGVLRALQEMGRAPAEIVATSAGAFVGAMVAGGAPLGAMVQTACAMRQKDIYQINRAALVLKGVGAASVVKPEPLMAFLRRALPVHDFADLVLPIRIVTTDLDRGTATVFGAAGRTDCTVPEAVYASMALPLHLPPALIGNGRFGDGGLVAVLPLELARAISADLVVAVDVGPVREAPPPGLYRAPPLLLAHDRAMAIQMADQRVRAVEAWQADPTRAPLVLVEPAVDPYGTFAFESTVDFIEAGYRATHAAMAAILRTQ